MRAECLPPASVTIWVNDAALQEHSIENEDAQTTSCYVEAINGAEFSVVLALEPEYAYSDEDLQFCVFIDGRQARSYLVNSTELGRYYTKTIKSAREYASYGRFTFAQHGSSVYEIATTCDH